MQNTTKKYKIFTENRTVFPQAWKPLIQEAKINKEGGHARKDFRVSLAKILMGTQYTGRWMKWGTHSEAG